MTEKIKNNIENSKISLEKVINKYLQNIRGIGLTAAISLPHINKWQNNEFEKLNKKISKLIGEPEDNESNQKTITLSSARNFAEFITTIRSFEETKEQHPEKILHKSLFTQLFSEFDSFIGDLLNTIYNSNEEILKSIHREIPLSDLLKFPDIESAKNHILNKEIETFRRESYAEQFINLEKKFSINLRKFSDWPAFIELSQRRNILIHNGGLVSEQYLTCCQSQNHNFEVKPNIGEQLNVTPEYFINAIKILSKVGFMLGYTLWLKIFPKEYQNIHTEINNTTYDLLTKNQWSIISEMTDFLLNGSAVKEISDIDLKIRIINCSLATKFNGSDNEANKMLDRVDWSASHRDFKLAVAVIKNNYSEAIEIMKSIGKQGELISQPDYHTWPLFIKFREQPEFYDVYREIYNEQFSEEILTPKGKLEAQFDCVEILEPVKKTRKTSKIINK